MSLNRTDISGPSLRRQMPSLGFHVTDEGLDIKLLQII